MKTTTRTINFEIEELENRCSLRNVSDLPVQLRMAYDDAVLLTLLPGECVQIDKVEAA